MTDLIALQKIAGWEKLKTLVLDSVSSPITKRVYKMALDEFMGWFQEAPRGGVTKNFVSGCQRSTCQFLDSRTKSAHQSIDLKQALDAAVQHIHRGCHSLHSNYMLNRGYAYTTIISSKYHGQILLSHLASLYPHSTRQAWQQKLNNGEVTLNGVTATGHESVTSGQTLVWNRPPWIEPDSPRHFEVLFEDAYLLAVNKPSGLPTLPGGGFMENTLLHCVQSRTPHANPVHRLGRATTGIVLFAKTPEAAAHLFANWNTPRIQKIYRALAQNMAQHDAYEILTPIGLVPHPLIGFVWAAHPGGKPSKSLAKVVSRGTDGTGTGTTTFEVSLNSGRPHQIRIHLASIGHPLVGDPLYGLTGQPLENLPGLPGDGGYFLHAQYLKFQHPITGKQINLEAALPSGFPENVVVPTGIALQG